MPDTPLVDEPSPDHPWPLARIRLHRGLSQIELAARLGVANTTVSAWEGAASPMRPLSRRVVPSWIAVAAHLSAILEVDPFAIAKCRCVLRPTAVELPPPRRGQPDRRAALLPLVHWLRGALASRGWAPADLAQRMGISEGTVAGWANGSNPPRPTHRAALAAVFGEPGLRQRLDEWAAASHPRTPGGKQHWTAEEDAYLLALPTLTSAALAAFLGRSETAVANRRWRLDMRRRGD